MLPTTTITDPNFTSPPDVATSTEPIDRRTSTQPATTTKRQATTRTAVTGTVFVRTTFAVTTTVDSVTLERDLTSIIVAALTRAGIAADVVVLVEQLALARRSNDWQASVFVQVAEGRAQATKDALQKLDDSTIQTQLQVGATLELEQHRPYLNSHRHLERTVRRV